MKTKLTVIFLFISLIGNHLIAQEKNIDRRYRGQEIGLRKFVATHIHYPGDALGNKLIGYSITSVTITPEGEISEISTINPICESIEKDINQVLWMTQKKWLKSDTLSTNQTFYIPIVYLLSADEERTALETTICEKYNFIEPIVVSAIGLGKEFSPESDELVATRLSDNLKKEDYLAALSCIDELIRRNPFGKQLYQLRISINTKLNKKDMILKDAQKMQNFIPGVSLDELINENCL